MTVWREKSESNKLFDERYFDANHFIFNGLKYLADPSGVSEVIQDCLLKLKNAALADFVISFLYHLARNPVLKEQKSFKDNEVLMSLIDEAILRLSLPDTHAIFALGNIAELLNKEQKERIRNELAKTDFTKISNDRIWRIILFFAKGDQTTVDQVKDAIIKDPKLWNSNITETQATSRIEYVAISRLRKKKFNPGGIVWNEVEAKLIYGRLKIEIDKISDFLKKRPDVVQYEFILREMMYFMMDEKRFLGKEENYSKYLKLAEGLFQQQAGFSSIEEGLISSEASQVVLALEEIAIQLYDKQNVEQQIHRIDLVLKKLMFQSQPALSESLSYISQWFFDFQKNPALRNMEQSILNILHKYYKSPPDEVETPYLEEKLAKLAVVLNEWRNSNDDIIPYYMSKIVAGRFNNLRTINDD